MELFKLLGSVVVDNSEANKSLGETSQKAKETSEKIKKSNEDTKKSNKGTETSWSSLKAKVAEYKAQGMSTSQAWRKATSEMKQSSEESSNGTVNAFKRIGLAVATYFTVDAIKTFGAGCIQAAADANAASSQFSQVFGDLEGKASKSLTSIADTSGISENRLKGSFTQIAAFAKTTGMDTSDALGLSERAMVAVADSAAFYDRSLEETTESLQSFLKGNYENDAALGLSCTEVTRNEAANKLYGKSFQELSESQKQLTLLQMVEDANKLSGAMGQAARESDTWGNVTGNLKQSWTDFQAVIGQNVLPIAVEAVKKLAGFVDGLAQKVPGLVSWFQQYQGVLGFLAVAIGVVTAAVTAYNIVQAIQTAMHAAEVTSLGALIAMKLASAAATMAALAPYILIAAAVAAVIAIGVLLYKNWDTVKAKALELKEKLSQVWQTIKTTIANTMNSIKSTVSHVWDAIKTAITNVVNAIKTKITTVWNAIKTAISTVLDAIKSVVTTIWNGIKNTVSSVVNAIKSVITSVWNGIKSTISNVMNSIKSTISNVWNGVKSTILNAVNSVKSTISSGFNAAKSTVSSVFDSIKSKISSVMDGAKNIVTSAVSKIKGAFNFSWSLPKLKLPHISVTGGKAPFGIGGKGSLPKFSISWYKKAMDNAMILNNPTVFGYSAASGNYLGAGEAGSEVVAGTNTLMRMIQAAVAEQDGNIVYYLQRLVELIGTFFPQIIDAMDREFVFDDGVIAARLAPRMDTELGKIRSRKDRGR